MFKFLKREMEEVIEAEVRRFIKEDADEIIDREIRSHLNGILGARLAGTVVREAIKEEVKRAFKDRFGY